MAHHDRPEAERDLAETQGRAQGDAGDDPRQGDGQQEEERDRLAAEEPAAPDRGGIRERADPLVPARVRKRYCDCKGGGK